MAHVTIDRKLRRKRRVRANITGTGDRPRVSVFRSSKYIYAQAIDDVARKTIVGFSSLQLARKEKAAAQKKTEQSKAVGMEFAKLLIAKKIKKCVFDRSSYAYNGRVKALAEGLREGGIVV